MYITITPQKLAGSYSQSVSDFVDYLETMDNDVYTTLHYNYGFDELAYDLIPKIRNLLVSKERSASSKRIANNPWHSAYIQRKNRRF